MPGIPETETESDGCLCTWSFWSSYLPNNVRGRRSWPARWLSEWQHGVALYAVWSIHLDLTRSKPQSSGCAQRFDDTVMMVVDAIYSTGSSSCRPARPRATHQQTSSHYTVYGPRAGGAKVPAFPADQSILSGGLYRPTRWRQQHKLQLTPHTILSRLLWGLADNFSEELSSNIANWR